MTQKSETSETSVKKPRKRKLKVEATEEEAAEETTEATPDEETETLIKTETEGNEAETGTVMCDAPEDTPAQDSRVKLEMDMDSNDDTTSSTSTAALATFFDSYAHPSSKLKQQSSRSMASWKRKKPTAQAAAR